MNSLFVAVGGGVGSLLRYGISFVHPYGPFTTFFVNVIGSFLLGFLTVYLVNRKRKLKFLLGTGFCGGFTTMSTMTLEFTKLSLDKALFYLISSLIVGFLAVIFGMRLAGREMENKIC